MLCTSDGSFIAVNYWGHSLAKVSRDGTGAGVYGKYGSGDGEFSHPSSLAASLDGGLVVREIAGSCFQVFQVRSPRRR